MKDLILKEWKMIFIRGIKKGFLKEVVFEMDFKGFVEFIVEK